MRITVAWELSWYQWGVDLRDEGRPVHAIDKGHEIGELDNSARQWNAVADDDGQIRVSSVAAPGPGERLVGARLVVNVDGGARGNPGPAAVAAVIRDADGKLLERRGELIGEATNNVAEYRAMLLGISRAAELGASEVELIGDSELVVRQLNGEYKVKYGALRELHAEVADALRQFEGWSIRHVQARAERGRRPAGQRDARRRLRGPAPNRRHPRRAENDEIEDEKRPSGGQRRVGWGLTGRRGRAKLGLGDRRAIEGEASNRGRGQAARTLSEEGVGAARRGAGGESRLPRWGSTAASCRTLFFGEGSVPLNRNEAEAFLKKPGAKFHTYRVNGHTEVGIETRAARGEGASASSITRYLQGTGRFHVIAPTAPAKRRLAKFLDGRFVGLGRGALDSIVLPTAAEFSERPAAARPALRQWRRPDHGRPDLGQADRFDQAERRHLPQPVSVPPMLRPTACSAVLAAMLLLPQTASAQASGTVTARYSGQPVRLARLRPVLRGLLRPGPGDWLAAIEQGGG